MRNVFLLIASQTLLSAQVITTVAGTGFVFPNSVPSLNAPLGRIYGVASDAKGNVYAADVDNQVIVQIAPSGTLTVVAGNGLFGTSGDGGVATNATLSNPNEVTLDAAGNIYFSEYGRIRKVSGGIVTTIAGNGNGGYGGDGGPATSALVGNNVTGVVVDAAGTVYIAEQDICRVRKIAAGIISTAVGTEPARSPATADPRRTPRSMLRPGLPSIPPAISTSLTRATTAFAKSPEAPLLPSRAEPRAVRTTLWGM